MAKSGKCGRLSLVALEDKNGSRQKWYQQQEEEVQYTHSGKDKCEEEQEKEQAKERYERGRVGEEGGGREKTVYMMMNTKTKTKRGRNVIKRM